MHIAYLAFVLGISLVEASRSGPLSRRDAQTAQICSTLASIAPGQVENPGVGNYTKETSSYWSYTEYLHPYCVFAPTSADSLAKGVKALADSKTTFAVRSGGHSPIAGQANTDHGVLVVTTHFAEMTVVKAPNAFGQTYFRMGAAQRWGQVYNFLNPQGLNVVGGRVAPVGSGLILGGGLSFLGYQHGWSSNNVVNFELVTAAGNVLQVNQKTYPDLFWALKGGSTNYGIVTRFDLKTYPQGKVFGGTIDYPESSVPQYLDAYQAWINPGGGHTDTSASYLPTLFYDPLKNATTASVVLLRNNPENNPKVFQNFTSIPATTKNVSVFTYNDLTKQTDFYAGTAARGKWAVTGISFFNESLKLQHDVFISTAQQMLTGLNCSVGISAESFSTQFQQANIDAGGDPMALDPAKGGFSVVLAYAFWYDESQDDLFNKYLDTLIKNFDDASKKINKYYPFIWLNNAGSEQDPIGTYGYGKSRPKMIDIAKKYDPNGVFQKQVPGFKLNGPLGLL